jgi:conjugative relaxase-like TrwC/TraI family protein
MIRMIQSKAAGHAKAYFTDALSKSDYYVNDQELAGYWQGKLAARLGVKGATTKEAFFALCENTHPVTGEPLTPRTREERTTGYDINFHCPKSVSVLHVLSKDDHILTAFKESVSETMQAIEADSKTRVRKNGTYDDRQTGELVWANFVHQTARPVEGFTPDPHLHCHCFVFNATYDEQEQRIKAGQFRDIKRDMPYYQARFQKTLADKLIAAGYAIRHTEKSFEIEGVPQRVIGLFSKRTDEIGRIAKEKGITDAKELDGLGARTRDKKQKGMSMVALKKEWMAQIAALPAEGGGKGEGETTVRFAPAKATPNLSAQQCVDYTILHSFERASVMPDRRLLETAYKFALGNSNVSINDITRAFKEDKRIIHVSEGSQTLCTTKEVLAEEKRMVELARQGQGKLVPLYDKAPDLNLKGQQAAAVANILTTQNRVSIIRGAAGSGKTTLMKEAIPKIEAAGKHVTVVAPSSDASRGVLRQEGFAGAETVARLLVDEKMQQQLKGQVLWVDEAGLLGTKDMLAILELATKNNTQVILGGDTRQHASVVRGDALRILNTVAGIQPAEVNKIYRQKNEQYLKAVEDLSKGDIKEGFEKLDAIGSIKTIDPMKPNEALVNDYIEALKRGKTTLVISPTHAQGDEVTNAIRDRLRIEGMIGKKEISVRQLRNLNYTEAQKSDYRNFEAGQVIQFNQNATGFKRGSRWKVEKVNETGVTIKNEAGELKSLPTDKSTRYDVYTQKEIALSKGDKIRITSNGFDAHDKRLNTGQLMEVVSISKSGNIELRNDQSHATYSLPQSFGHLDHAHCITSYASQGKTVDEVFIAQPAATFTATNAKQFYVSVSRGKERAIIYTDDREELLHHASELGIRQSAMELVGKDRTKNIIPQRTQPEPTKPKENTPTKNTKQRKDYEPHI